MVAGFVYACFWPHKNNNKYLINNNINLKNNAHGKQQHACRNPHWLG